MCMQTKSHLEFILCHQSFVVLSGLSNLSNVEDDVDNNASRPVRDMKVSCNTTYSLHPDREVDCRELGRPSHALIEHFPLVQ